MQISSTGAANLAALRTVNVKQPASQPTTANEDPAAMIRDITRDGMKGYMKWQMEELKKKVAAKVMQQMGITTEDLQKMAPEVRKNVEDLIAKEVERIMRQMIAEQMQKENKSAFPMAQAAATGAAAAGEAQLLNLRV